MRIKTTFLQKKNRVWAIFAAFLLVTVASDALSAEIEIPSSFNPVGSGARALGMGGAFIAVADDATAASWNPGGLTQLKKPECSVVFSGLHRKEDISFGTNPEGDGMQSVSEEDLNYLSVTYPFEAWGRNMVVSLAYQHLYDFYREWDFRLKEDSEWLKSEDNWNFTHNGRLSAVGLSYCVRVIPQLSLGVTFNVWDDDLTKNEWTQEYQMKSHGTFGNKPLDRYYHRTTQYSFEGFNMNFGVLYRVNHKLTLGAVLKTPFTAEIENKTYANLPFDEVSVKNEKLDMPMSYGIGFKYNFSDNFSISGDVYRTEWDDYIYRKENGEERSPITLKLARDSDIDPTYQIRLGAEYCVVNKEKEFIIPLRCGIFYDPAPADGSPDDFYGFSLGIGFTRNNRFSLDVAYQYRFGNDVGEMYLEHLKFSQDVEEHTLYASLILYKW